MDDREYWNKFYKENKETNLSCSSFANFSHQWVDNRKRLIELGCGNGRDSIHFLNSGLNVTSIDNAKETIKELQKNHPEINSICMDIDDIDSLQDTYEIVYSRFFLHSIDEERENKLLSWAYKSLSADGILLIEARTTKDKDLRKTHDGHFRRYIDPEGLKNKLLDLGFNISYSIESRGLSVYGSEDPYLLRVIAQKEGG